MYIKQDFSSAKPAYGTRSKKQTHHEEHKEHEAITIRGVIAPPCYSCAETKAGRRDKSKIRALFCARFPALMRIYAAISGHFLCFVSLMAKK